MNSKVKLLGRKRNVGGPRLLGNARDADQHDEEMGARTSSQVESPFKTVLCHFHPSTLFTTSLLGHVFSHSIDTNECDGFNKPMGRHLFSARGLIH